MRISCTQENLNKGLQIVSHIASKNTSLPILNNVLVQAEGGTITLMTTNLEMGIQCVVRGKVENEGTYTVQSKLIHDYVTLLPSGVVNLSVNNDFLEIAGGRSQTKIKGNAADEFPVIPQVSKQQPYKVSAQEFIKGLGQVIFATSPSETRPEISGVYFNFENETLTMAATDSYRLAEKQVSLKANESGVEREVIVPGRTVTELYRVLTNLRSSEAFEAGEQPDVEIYFEDNQILFVFGPVELVSRLIEGQYPSYKQIIPGSFTSQIIVPVAELIKATKTASLFSRTGVFDVTLATNKGTFKISSTNNQLGENTSEVDGRIEGDDNTIVVNYRYLLDGLQAMDATDVIIEISDGVSPCVLKPAESLDGKNLPVATDNYLYIIMPIKQ